MKTKEKLEIVALRMPLSLKNRILSLCEPGKNFSAVARAILDRGSKRMVRSKTV